MIIDGIRCAKEILERTAHEVRSALLAHPPTLAIIFATDDAPSRAYVARKQARAAEIGIATELFEMPEATTTTLLEKIAEIEADSLIDGLIVQLPLPAHIDRDTILAALPPEKDVDMLSPVNRETCFLEAPMVQAVAYVLERHGVATQGKKVTVLGSGILVGEPLAKAFRAWGSLVTVIDRPVDNLGAHTLPADIIVCGTGVPSLLKSEYVQPGVIVIDAGMKSVDGVLRGDAEPAIAEKAQLFTPTPGGLGPMVVATLLRNVVHAAQKR